MNDCDIAHLSNVVQWSMGSQLLGEKHTHSSAKWSNHVMEATRVQSTSLVGREMRKYH